MKVKNILMTGILALAGIASANAAAPNYTSGDLIMGIWSTATQTAYEFDLGHSWDYRDATSGFKLSINIASDLQTAFGTTWTTDSTLKWAIIGTMNTGSNNETAGAYTSYISQTEATLGTKRTYTNMSGSGTRATVNTTISGYTSLFAGSTATADSNLQGVEITDNRLANNFSDANVKDSNGYYFQTANTYVGGSFAPTTTALDLYRVQDKASNNASYEGSFAINNSGDVYYFSSAADVLSMPATSVPEPSTYAILAGGIATLGLLRRRSVANA